MKATLFGKSVLFTWICLLFINLERVASYRLIGNTIRDLDDDSRFAQDAVDWYMSSYVNPGVKTYKCTGTNMWLMGGYNILGGVNSQQYFERQYSGIPPHNLIKFSMTFQPIDSWDGYPGGLNGGNDHFELWFDGVHYEAWRLSIFDRYAVQICGSENWADFPPIELYMTIPHQGSNLRLQIVNFLDQASNDESFGFRDIVMVFDQVSDPTPSLCGVCPGSPLPEKICDCSGGSMYMAPPKSGHCFQCNAACPTCEGGDSSSCLTCPAGKFVQKAADATSGPCIDCAYNCATCNGASTTSCLTCKPAYPYWINSNQCVQTCNAPLQYTPSGSNTVCYSPCTSTPSTPWLLWDGQCHNVCSAIFLKEELYNTFKLCTYPCSAASPFMYWDGVCDSSCPTPLTTRDFHGKSYCDHTCATTSDYLYWDVLCESTCPYPLKYTTTHNRKICIYPCADAEYLYWDQTCGTTCFYPLVIRIYHGKQFCDFPCGSNKFLYWDNTCKDACPYPLYTREERGVKYCDYPCSGSEFLYWNRTCLPNCNSPPLTQRFEGTARYCDYPCQPSQTLHWLGTCITSSACAFPRSFKQEGNPNRNFCYYPCNTNQYLYWNGTCANTCNAPLKNVPTESRNFCQYPCDSTQYLYWNGSCKASCPDPLTTRLEAGLKYCDYPCTGSEFLYWNKSCIASCASPLKERTTDGDKFCDYPCDVSQYLYWEGTCGASCDPPLTYRPEKGRNYCDYKCTTPTDYLYWNGSCIGECTLFTKRPEKGKNFCDFQCGSNYIYWDRSCSGSCALPLQTYTEGSPIVKNFCAFPCEAQNDFLYWNGTCLPTCDFPLDQRLQNSRNFCSMPCDSNQYLYWNGSCKATCPDPLKIREEAGRKYCDYPCLDTEYLYWNKSCKAACASPLTPKLVDGNYFCEYTCTDTSMYLYWDKTCQASCSAPLTPVVEGTPSRKFCTFGCDDNDFLYWDGTCKSTCAYPLEYTTSNNRKYCKYPCTDINQYLYWDKTCSNSCPYPHDTRVENLRNFCDYPCTGSDIVYWNKTCLPSCNLPLSKTSANGKYYCKFPCTDSNQFLYWDATCQNACDSPLTQKEEAGKKYCQNNCMDLLYWNGSCLDTCPSPLKTKNANLRNYCNYPCQTSEFAYWNNSCKAGCAFPLTTRIESERNYCDYPCTGTNYLYWNGSCISTCILPLEARITDGNRYCDFKCADNEILTWDGVCTTTCAAPRALVTEGTPARSYCRYPCTANQFLYWNGTCSGTCSFPYTNKAQGSRLFCEYPCTDVQFLSWNGTCLDACPLPYVARMEATKKYCGYPCAANQYLAWDGTCQTSCDPPLVQRTNLTNKFCDFPCDESSYLYWDGSCASSCAPPLVQSIEGDRLFCTYKCASASDSLYWDGTCGSSCEAPLVEIVKNGKKICTFPCDPSKYLYWDGTCMPSCDAPLVSKTEGDRKFCDYQCSSSQYLNWDGTCIDECSSEYSVRADRGMYFCDFPCDAIRGHYLYWNGTCSFDCPAPFVQRTETTGAISKTFCDFACPTGQYLTDWSKSCVASCDAPYIATVSSEGTYCSLPCESATDFYFTELNNCKSSCEPPYTMDLSSPYRQCIAPVLDPSAIGGDSGSGYATGSSSNSLGGTLFNALFLAPVGNGTVTLVKVVKVMQYLRFLDIKLPPRLERLGSSQGRLITSIQANSRVLSQKAGASDIASGSLPSVFSRTNLDYTFVVNYWGTFLFIVAAIAAAIMFTIFRMVAHKYKWRLAEAIFKVGQVICRWNLVIMLLATSIDDIILYTSIEFKTTNANSATSANYFSLILCVIFIGLSLGLIAGVYLLIRKYQKLKRSVLPDKFTMVNFETKWQDYQVIFRGFKDTKPTTAYFFLIYIFRIGVPMFFTVIAPSVPVLITMIQVIASIFILGYLLKMKPFKKTVNQVQLVIYELTALVMNLCMVMLAIKSPSSSENSNYIVTDSFSIVLGDIVIFGNDIINAMPIIFFVIRFYMEYKAIKKYLKTLKVTTKVDKVRYLQLISLVLQQINMGFEEMMDDCSPEPAKNSARGFMKDMVKEADFDTKSISSIEKPESRQRYNRVRSTTPLTEEKTFLFGEMRTSKDENSVVNILNGLKDQPVGESIFAQKTEDIDLSSQELRSANKKPRYQRLESNLSPTADKKASNFDFTQSSIINQSPTLNPFKPEQDFAVNDMDLEETKPAQTSSVYQVVVPQKTPTITNKKAKKFLTYNWQDVNSLDKTEENKSLGESVRSIPRASPEKGQESVPDIFGNSGMPKFDVSSFVNEEKEEDDSTPTQKRRMRKGKSSAKVVPN